jgi:hypothetical protein
VPADPSVETEPTVPRRGIAFCGGETGFRVTLARRRIRGAATRCCTLFATGQQINVTLLARVFSSSSIVTASFSTARGALRSWRVFDSSSLFAVVRNMTDALID